MKLNGAANKLASTFTGALKSMPRWCYSALKLGEFGSVSLLDILAGATIYIKLNKDLQCFEDKNRMQRRLIEVCTAKQTVNEDAQDEPSQQVGSSAFACISPRLHSSSSALSKTAHD